MEILIFRQSKHSDCLLCNALDFWQTHKLVHTSSCLTCLWEERSGAQCSTWTPETDLESGEHALCVACALSVQCTGASEHAHGNALLRKVMWWAGLVFPVCRVGEIFGVGGKALCKHFANVELWSWWLLWRLNPGEKTETSNLHVSYMSCL